jgi:cellulose synthase/poly-beta-1,6-N-acetylglucosamine synthase-like glycosyltransferase
LEPDVSIVIPCRGHARALRRCLESVSAQRTSRLFEVIVVDSAYDEAVAGVVAAFPAVRLVRSHEGLRPGPAAIRVRHARGAILLSTLIVARPDGRGSGAAIEGGAGCRWAGAARPAGIGRRTDNSCSSPTAGEPA